MNLWYTLLFLSELAIAFIIYPIILTVAVAFKIFQWIFIHKSAKSISGEVAVVTGGAHGLGREICLLLASHGCHIAVVDINLDGADETVDLIKSKNKVKAKAYKVDITSFDEVIQLKQKVTEDFGTATILINNAGILFLTKYPNPDWREVQRLINVNYTSQFWTLEAFLPDMKNLKKGHVVSICSIAGLFPLVYNSQYVSSKFAVRGLMKCLRQELIAENLKNVHTTTVYPYFLSTNKAIAEAYTKTGYNERYSMVMGTDAAKSIVDGMLRNEVEIMLPSLVGLLYRLYELLPVRLQDWLIRQKTQILTPDMMVNINKGN